MPVDIGDAHPQRGTVLDLVPASRGETFMSWADAVGDDLPAVMCDNARSWYRCAQVNATAPSHSPAAISAPNSSTSMDNPTAFTA